MAIAHVKAEDMKFDFVNGYAEYELLPGMYEGMTTYRNVLKAGCTISPKVYDDSLQILCLTDGNGYIVTPGAAFTVDELSFFSAKLGEAFSITAVTDMTYTTVICKMNEKDWYWHNKSHLSLPYFRKFSDCLEYWQSCKTVGMRSWHVFSARQMFPIIMGVCQTDMGGTIEHGHPGVAQWNVMLEDTEMTFIVGDESIPQKGGDFSYVAPGPDHSLISKPGKQLFYIWIEHFTPQRYDNIL